MIITTGSIAPATPEPATVVAGPTATQMPFCKETEFMQVVLDSTQQTWCQTRTGW
jgi:hypothetical protein